MPRRGKLVTAILSIVFLSLAVAVFVVGRLPLLHIINNVLVIAALPWILVRTFLLGKRDHDFVVLRRGLSVFVALALWDNLGGAAWLRFDIEPYGFAVLLGCLGYVAARRTLERDQQLGEIQKELEVARSIQLSILPGAFPVSADFQVAARYVPMMAVAGDLYDFLMTDARRAGLLIADVSGHGVPAALIASMVKMAATSQRDQAAHPARLLAGMNAALCGNTQGQFVTAAYVHLDAQRRELRYAAAGHPAMLLLRNGRVIEIAENGLLLAATDDALYTEKSMTLERGDRLLLYTDGLLEAKNGDGRLFGDESLAAALRNTAALTPVDAVERIIAEVQHWAATQEDDLTALVCDFVGTA
jgi:sigma-B regulation protein RsbU (phosphoserine phosphatase)